MYAEKSISSNRSELRDACMSEKNPCQSRYQFNYVLSHMEGSAWERSIMYK